MSRDGGTLAVYDNTKFSIYCYTNSTWPFVRTKTVSPYLVVLSHEGASLGSISVSSLYAYAFRGNTTLVLLQGTNSASRLLFSGDETILVTGDSLNRDMIFFQYDATLVPPVFSFIQDGSAHSASVHVFSGNGDVSSDVARALWYELRQKCTSTNREAWAQLGSDIEQRSKNYILNTKACTHNMEDGNRSLLPPRHSSSWLYMYGKSTSYFFWPRGGNGHP